MKVFVKNIGGFIGEHVYELKEGINEVVAPNAGGKTSFVRAILAALNPGDPNVRPEDLLNLDADEGFIRIEVDGEEYYRVFRRVGDRVVEVSSKLFAADERFSWLLLDPFMGRLVSKILSGEEDVTDFIDLTFELSRLRKMIEAKRAKENELQTRREDLLEKSKELARLVIERSEIERKLAALESEVRKVETEKIRVKEEVEKTIRELRERVGELRGRLESYRKEFTESLERARDIEAKIKALEEQVEGFYLKHPNPDAELKAIDAEIDDIRRMIEEHSARLMELNKVAPVVVDAMRVKPPLCPVCGRTVENPDKFWGDKARELNEAVKEINKSIEDLRARELERLNKKGSIEKELAKIRNIEGVELPSLRRRLEIEKSNARRYEESIADIEAQIRVYEERIRELESRVPEEERKRIEEQARVTAEKKALEQYLDGIRRRIENLGDVGRELEEVERELAEVMREREMLEEKLHRVRSGVALEFRRLANEVMGRLGFEWFKSVVLDEKNGRYFVRVVRRLPSGREEKQSLRQLSTSEKVSVALTAVLAGYKLGIAEGYPQERTVILADEALLAFDPDRYERIVGELEKYGRYVVVTRLGEPAKTPKLVVVHKR